MKSINNLKILLIIVTLFGSFNSIAQVDPERHIRKGDFMISTGYGFPSALRVYLNRERADDDLTVKGYGPALLKFHYALSNKFTIGIHGFYNYSDVHWLANAKDLNGNQKLYRHGVQVWEAAASARVNYYFLKKKGWNMYGGVAAGMGFANAETYTYAPKEKIYINHRFPPPYNFEGTIGAQYFVSNSIGLYTELGIGQGFLLYKYYFIPAAVAQFGLTIKL